MSNVGSSPARRKGQSNDADGAALVGQVLSLLREHPDGLTTRSVLALAGARWSTTSSVLAILADAGLAVSTDGRGRSRIWRAVPAAGQHAGNTFSPSEHLEMGQLTSVLPSLAARRRRRGGA